MPKAKQKSKSCNRGYPCGGSCISRGFNCRKKLTGQGKNYADWLKGQGDKLGDRFNQEAGARLGRDFYKTASPKSLKGFIKDIKNLIDTADNSILSSDLKMLDYAKQNIKRLTSEVKYSKNKLKNKDGKLSKFDREWHEQTLKRHEPSLQQAKQEKADLEKSIKDREAEIKARTPANNIKKFEKMSDLNRELMNLKNKNIPPEMRKDLNKLESLKEKLEGIKSKYQDESKDPQNTIVPFKKKRSKDFAEETSLVRLYLDLRSQIIDLLLTLGSQNAR
jgi:hypothetical protein